MKKLALIGSFCNTEDKEEILYQNVVKMKSLGIDTLVLSPIPISKRIIDEADFYFQTKENPLLGWPIYMYNHWYEIRNHQGKLIKLERGMYDYGYAGLYQVKKLGQIGMTFDYDIFYQMIYDVLIDDRIVEDIQRNEVNVIYPRRDPHHPETIWGTTLHFMIFDRAMMQRVIDDITVDKYIAAVQMAEGHAHDWVMNFEGLSVSTHPIKDQIFFFEDVNLFTYSKNPSYDIFWGKNELGPASFVFTRMTGEVKVTINNVTYTVREPWVPVQTYDWEVQEFIVETEDARDDYTQDYNKTMRNVIFVNQPI